MATYYQEEFERDEAAEAEARLKYIGGYFQCDGDEYLVINTGTINQAGYLYVHGASTTRFRHQRNGKVPAQVGLYIKPSTIYSTGN